MRRANRKTHFVGEGESEEAQRVRFQIELEFVQCLANPNYLNFLAQRGYFKEAPFINYLKYLLYWKEPEYAKFLKFEAEKPVYRMSDKVVLSYYDSLIHESDLRLLEGRNWLNDSLISFWFEHLVHEAFPFRHRLLFISPEVTQLIKMGDLRELPVFLDPLDAKFKDYIFLPVNDNSSMVASGGSHWSLLVFSKFDNKFYHYDSQRGSNYRDARMLVHRFNTYLGRDIPATLVDANCTQQDNSYDCGAYVMIYALKAAELAVKSMELGTCYVDRQEVNKMRELIKSLVYSLRR